MQRPQARLPASLRQIGPASTSSAAAGRASERLRRSAVTYRIDEGAQLRVGSVKIEGNEHVKPSGLTLLLNTTPGQLLSPQNLAGDRDALLTDYLSRGFEQRRWTSPQQPEPADSSKVDVVFHVTEGQQVFVRKVLLTGLHYTRPETVARPSPSTPAIR